MNISFAFSPTPEVVWLKNSVTLPDTYEVSHGGHELTIANLTKNDAGQYECIGTNSLGHQIFRSFRSFVVRVECKDRRKWFFLTTNFFTSLFLFKRNAVYRVIFSLYNFRPSTPCTLATRFAPSCIRQETVLFKEKYVETLGFTQS